MEGVKESLGLLIKVRKIGLRRWKRRIICRTTPEEQTLILKRLYRQTLAYGAPDRPGKRRFLWTKGGRWVSDTGMARILVLREHLDRPYHKWTEYLKPDTIRSFESELRVVANPDKFLYPDVYYMAINYVRERAKHYWGRRMGWMSLSWFFDQPIIDPEKNYIWDWKNFQEGGYPTRWKRAAPPTW